MSRSDVGAAVWFCETIKHHQLLSSRIVGDNLIEVMVKEVPNPVRVAVISVPSVTAQDVSAVTQDNSVEFVLNVPRNAMLTGEAIQRAIDSNVGIGGVGDFYVAMSERDFRGYIDKEMRFTLRGLKQHSAVREVIRRNDRFLEVIRWKKPPLNILVLHDYDFSADALRSGVEKYGRPDIVLVANPNANISGSCTMAAHGMSLPVMKWGPLLGALNN